MNQIISKFWNSKWLLTVTAGLLLGLSYPPIPLPILLFPAFILIFRIIDLSNSPRAAAYYTYPAFLIWNVITTYWLMMATLAGGIAAILANAALMTIPVMLFHYFQQRYSSIGLIALLQSASWLSYEFLHHQWDLAWPWLTLGNAWANAPLLIQYISVTGYWGISIWIIFVSSLAYQLILVPAHKLKWIVAGSFLLFPMWSFALALFNGDTSSAEIQEVVVVQPNFDSYEQYGGFPNPEEATWHLLQLTDSIRTDSTDLIVWPENALQSNVSSRTSNNGYSVKNLLDKKAKEWGTTLISGATYYEYYEDGDAPLLPYQIGDQAFLPFNAALGFQANSSYNVYHKRNLVPIVERIPFVHLLDRIDVFNWFDWSRHQGYGKGNEPSQFSVGQTNTPALICYDSVFPGWIRNFLQQDAGYLTIITNDGWWGDTSGHEQHFAYARLRAIEFDRWMVRSANNGISGIIDSNGSVKVKTPYWETTAFRYNVPVRNTQTIYSRFGDWLPKAMLLLMAIALLQQGVIRRFRT